MKYFVRNYHKKNILYTDKAISKFIAALWNELPFRVPKALAVKLYPCDTKYSTPCAVVILICMKPLSP